MIYLIDDKQIRQKNYSWTTERLQSFENQLFPVYTKEVLDQIKADIFEEGNVILFHDSFFDNPENKHERDVDQIRQQLIKESATIPVVFFGGAAGCRTIENLYASLPVSILYANLEYFIIKYEEDPRNVNLKYLAFGLNYIDEEIEVIKKNIWKLLYPLNNTENLEITAALEEEIMGLLSITQQEDLMEEIIAKCKTAHYLKFYLSELIYKQKYV